MLLHMYTYMYVYAHSKSTVAPLQVPWCAMLVGNPILRLSLGVRQAMSARRED